MPRKIPIQYQIADKAIALLNKRATKRFDITKNRLSLLRFDELSVIKELKKLYAQLAEDNEEIFLELAQMVYKRTRPNGGKKPDEAWLLAFLDAYNETTLYVYNNEVERKREYTTEAINSSPEKSVEFRRALMKWATFTTEYADQIADEAMLKSYDDAGVKKVQWVTERDRKVCPECRALDGQVFPIDEAPPKAHWHCRCWYIPAD